MQPYHKIQSVFKRDPETKFKTFLVGEFSMPEFEYLQHNIWTFTEKVDGTNIRVHYNGAVGQPDAVTFGGRTDRADTPPFLLDVLAETFPQRKLEAVFGETSVTLYGEGYGARIQKGGDSYLPDTQSFILFDVLVEGNEYALWLERHNVEDIVEKLGISVVPLVGEGTLPEAIDLVKQGLGSSLRDRVAEGIVLRPKTELQTRDGKRIIAKIKHTDFA